MDIIDFHNIKIDPIDDVDIRNGYYMRDILGYENYKILKLPKMEFKDSFFKALLSFKMYGDNDLLKEIFDKKTHFDYLPKLEKNYNLPKYTKPYCFNTQILLGNNSQMVPTIIYPDVLDDASYAFFGHEFNHCVKDVYLEERTIRDRVSDVIPMFHELLCSDYEKDKHISKEIKKRRLDLLQLDKYVESEADRQIQYYNSFYYVLALYNIYKDDSNKVLILRLISRVLKGDICTLDMLEMLNIYGVDLDDMVSCELDNMKEYVLK